MACNIMSTPPPHLSTISLHLSRANRVSQTEKAFVTGVEAANAVVKRLGVGRAASIIPLEGDEPHIRALRAANSRAKRAVKSLPGAGWLLP